MGTVKEVPVKRVLVFVLAVGWIALAGVSSAKEEVWGLFLDFGAPLDASPFPPIAGDFVRLANHLSGLTGSPRERFVVSPPVSSRSDAQEKLRSFAARVPPKSLVYLYIRAYVTKPPTENALYFYPPGASLRGPLTASPPPIRDSEFLGWLQPFRASETFLFLDLRTTMESLNVFYGNRSLLGTYALTLIARRPLAETMAALLRRAFTRHADSDDDGALLPDELTDAFQREVYKGNITSSDAIVALTGTPDKVLATFPAALRIDSQPAGATVLLDGKEIGKTPLVYKNLVPKEYTVAVSLDGYRTVEPQKVTVTRLIGKDYSVSFPLEAVRIRGSVKVPPSAYGIPIRLTVHPEVGLSAPLSPTGVFEFSTKGIPFVPNREYRVIAATADDRFVGEAKFVFTGHEDVDVALALRERTAWELAALRYARGLQKEALDAATKARNAAYEIPKLPEDFARFLLERWARETTSARAMIGCAWLSLQLGDANGSQVYWRLAKRAAKKGSPDYEYAIRHLRTGDSTAYLVALVLLLAVLASLVWAIRRHRARALGA